MIEFVGGDVLTAATQFIAQGVAVGSQEGLGTGLALKISAKWPDAQKLFKKHTRNHRFEGGDIFAVAPTEQRPGLIYIATQPDMRHATVEYVNRGLRELARYCAEHGVTSLALPKIGSGLGKLDWAREVKPLMLRHLAAGVTVFMVFEDFKNEYQEEPG